WATTFAGCAHPGCVTATLTTTTGGIRLDNARDPEAAKLNLEVLLAVKPAAGKSAAPLTVELPTGVDKLSGGVSAGYEGATISVLDVSPFARTCGEAGKGCVFLVDTVAPTAP